MISKDLRSMKILLNQHSGSANHGCEAILRSAAAMLSVPLSLRTGALREDQSYGVDRLFQNVYEIPGCGKWSPRGILRQLEKRLDITFPGNPTADATILDHIADSDVVLNVGGDVYCYFQGRDQWATDRLIRQSGKKLVLFGCSLEPEDVAGTLGKHLKNFDLIIARESLTYEALKKCPGLRRVELCPDPAFTLPREKADLPEGFTPGNMVGINISPLLVHREKTPGIVMENARELIRIILGRTDMGVALIPHVVAPGNDDRTCLAELYRHFADTGRIVLANDQNCCKLKDMISMCRFLITARTHASIAGYSSGVPTLVLGYSVKAKGIARDLFGSEDGMVLPVEKMTEKDCLYRSFLGLMEREEEVRGRLAERMPDYISRAGEAGKMIEEVAEG